MARITAAEVRALTNRGKPDGILDSLLDEIRGVAMMGESEFPISPMHPFNKQLTDVERNQLKGQLQGLGFTLTTRSFPETNIVISVITW